MVNQALTISQPDAQRDVQPDGRQDNGCTRILVHLPLALRDHTRGEETVEVEGATVRAALADLVRRFPPLRRHLYTDAGELRGYVNVYVNDDEVRGLVRGDRTPVRATDTLMIIPSIAGG